MKIKVLMDIDLDLTKEEKEKIGSFQLRREVTDLLVNAGDLVNVSINVDTVQSIDDYGKHI